MFPPSFDYVAATSVDDAVAALADGGEDARVLAGGQSLIPIMKQRLGAPELLVDINGIAELSQIGRSNGELRIGALARHADVVDSDDTFGAIAGAAPWIADPIVRNRGTLCGSVAHCDPEGDWNSVMLATGATVVAQGPGGERTIPIDEFVVSLFTNSLQPGEMVTEVRVPVPSGRSGGTYMKLERKVGDYATVGVAAHLELADDGTIARAGIAMTSVAPINRRATAAEALLVGQEPSDDALDAAAAATAEAAEPHTDVRGTADWKREVVRIYTRRGLAAALAQAQG